MIPSLRHRMSDDPLPLPILLFVLILLVPHTLAFFAGPVLITSYRALMIALTPFIVRQLQRRHVALGLEDALIGILTAWSTTCIFINYGLEGGIERAGQFLLEVTAAYFLARAYFTRLGEFYRFLRLFFWAIAISFVLAIPEAITHAKPIIEYTSKLTGINPSFYLEGSDIRMGLRRAQASFENAILFGMFCASSVSLIWYSEARLGPRLGKVAVALAATFLSLSSAPLLAIAVQIVMIAVETLTRTVRNRLAIIGTAALLVTVAVNTLTKSGIISLIINHLTFNQTSSYNRVLIWQFGIDNINRHPIFGMIPDQWERADTWMVVSIDNFWIYTGLLSGYPGWATAAAFVLSVIIKFGLVDDRYLTRRYRRFRIGWMIMIVAFTFTGFSVMFFGKLQPLYYFMLGIGAAATRLYQANAEKRRHELRFAGDERVPSTPVAAHEGIPA